MSMGPLGIAGSIAGSPLAQTAGTDRDRSAQDVASQSRQVKASEKAEAAEGIGQTEEDTETSDRDADGRRLWENMDNGNSDQAAEEESVDATAHRTKDHTGLTGNQIDLSG